MRVIGLAGAAASNAPAAARRPGGGTFKVSDEQPSKSAAQAGGLRAVSSLDALIALQGVEDPTERRKRAVQKGRNALDALDGIKIGLLDGDLDPAMLRRLKSVADGLKERSGDLGLDNVLAEIELRVKVELAKAAVG
jgi:hypothetical protein